jgi:hypothetical protein
MRDCVARAARLQEHSWAAPLPAQHGERGKRHSGAPTLGRQTEQGQRHLRPKRRGGGPVVVGGRESRPHGEGDQ